MANASKQNQTFVNLFTREFNDIQKASDNLAALKVKYLAKNPDSTGSILDGNVPAMNTAINDVKNALTNPVIATIAAGFVPTHQEVALDD